MSAPDTLLLCSETDNLADMLPAFDLAANELCPGLRTALWTPGQGLAGLGPARVVSMAAWFPPLGLPASLPGLRLLASIGAGAEHLLRDPALPTHLPVTRIVDPEQARGMAEFVLWATLYYHRGLDHAQQQQRQGLWRMPPQRPAADTHVGIMGLGAMGEQAARVLAAHGFSVSGWARGRRELPGVRTFAGEAGMDAFLRPLDVVVSLLPLTPQTRGLCDARWFARLKPGACLVNCGRGEQVLIPDLLEALERGQLRGAVLDVFEHEPLPPRHPLWRTPRVLVTPHMASAASTETIARQIVANTARVREGLAPLHAVDTTRGY